MNRGWLWPWLVLSSLILVGCSDDDDGKEEKAPEYGETVTLQAAVSWDPGTG